MHADTAFRRNVFVIAGLHVVAVAIVFAFGSWHHKSHTDKVMWLDGGSLGGAGAQAAESAPEPPVSSEPEPKPAPRSKLDPPPPPLTYPAPSELVMPNSTPRAPTPKAATVKPTPRHITPKPTPKHTPKPKPPTPKPEAAEVSETSSPKPKASPSEKPANNSEVAKTEGTPSAIRTAGTSRTPGASPSSSPAAGSGSSEGSGSGNGKGTAKSGKGSGTSEFGWYFSMIHDRFHNRWDQPSTVPHGAQDMVTTLKIRIGKDGTILSRDIVHSSGDSTMDESVMTAAERVQQIDPLPPGLGNGDSYEINIAFKLDQSQ